MKNIFKRKERSIEERIAKLQEKVLELEEKTDKLERLMKYSGDEPRAVYTWKYEDSKWFRVKRRTFLLYINNKEYVINLKLDEFLDSYIIDQESIQITIEENIATVTFVAYNHPCHGPVGKNVRTKYTMLAEYKTGKYMITKREECDEKN